MSSTILLGLLAATFALLAYWYYVYWFKFLKLGHKMKYLKPWPLIGNALEILPLTEVNQIMVEVTARLGKTFKGIIGFDTIIFTTDEKFIETIATSKDLLTKADEYDALVPWLNRGLLTSTGKKWMKRRKLLTPSFHFNILEDFISIFNNCSTILVDKLRNEVGNEFTNVYPYITLCSLDVIYESTMGVKVDAQLKENSEYVQMVKLESRIVFNRVCSVLKRFNLLYKLSRDYRKEQQACKILHDTTDKIITERRKLLLNKNNNVEENNNSSSKKRRSFMDILLESTIDGEPLSNLDIREEVDTFLFEGHDTTSSAITYAMYELSVNPHVQAKVVEELDALFGNDKTRSATLQDLQEMKYLEMTIKETLRKYPSVPIMARKSANDVQYDGMVVPKGTTVAFMPYALHRNPVVFPDPEKFDPDRFLPENKANIGPYAYIPFSVGYRNCIGQKFAMLEVKALLAKMLRNFELRPVKNFKPKNISELILRSSNGILIQIRDRVSN